MRKRGPKEKTGLFPEPDDNANNTAQAPKTPQKINEETLPHNERAEEAVLAAILQKNTALADDVFRKLVPEDFFFDQHCVLFSAMRLLYERGVAIDDITLREQLENADDGNGEGDDYWHQAIKNIAQLPPHDAIPMYITVIRDTAMARRLINALKRSLKACQSRTPASELFSFALDQIWMAGEEGGHLLDGPKAISEHLQHIIPSLETMYTTREKVLTGIATGLRDLDRFTGGLHKNELIVVGGRPSMGKTALILQFALHAAQKDKKVLLFPFETTAQTLLQRLLCVESRVDCHKLRTGYLGKDDFRKIADAAERLKELPIFIDDTAGLGVHEIWARARAVQNANNGLDMVIIDTVQLINTSGEDDAETRAYKLGVVIRGLKYMARNLDVALVATSGLTRDLEKRSYKKPYLSDLRESGLLEDLADMVMFLYREEVYKPTEENAGLAELIVAKQHNGPTGIVKLVFLREFTRFETLLDM